MIRPEAGPGPPSPLGCLSGSESQALLWGSARAGGGAGGAVRLGVVPSPLSATPKFVIGRRSVAILAQRLLGLCVSHDTQVATNIPMPKPGLRKMTVKAAGGVKKTIEKPATASGPVDPATEQARKAANEKSRKTRAIKTAGRKADVGFECLGVASLDEETSWLVNWMAEPARRGIAGFVATLARQGRLEKAWKADAAPEIPAGFGKKIIPRLNLKFRNLGARDSLWFLSKMGVSADLMSWFTGQDKLSIDVAPKALRNILRVGPGTPLPAGHTHCQYQVPLLHLFIQVWKMRGCTGSGLTKAAFDVGTDWFALVPEDAEVLRVYCPLMDPEFEKPIDVGLALAKKTSGRSSIRTRTRRPFSAASHLARRSV